MEPGLLKVFPDSTRQTDDGHLLIGGCDTVALAEEFGTPLYVYDETTRRSRCRSFVEEFSRVYEKVQVVYASKAYTTCTFS